MEYYKTPKMIEVETGKKFVDICKELISDGLSPTEIARKLKLKNTGYISQSLFYEKVKDKKNVLYPQLENLSSKQLVLQFPKIMGMEYKDFLYQKYFIEGHSMYEIASMIGQTIWKIQTKMENYGFRKTLSQARQDAMKKGVINYNKITISTRITKRKSNSNSNTQEIVRDMFKSQIEFILPSIKKNEIEIIIGYDEYSILGDMEVDIPIIVFNLKQNTYKKYAVELNGQYHEGLKMMIKDNEKNTRLLDQSWTTFTILYTNSNEKLEHQVKEIVNNIVLEFI